MKFVLEKHWKNYSEKKNFEGPLGNCPSSSSSQIRYCLKCLHLFAVLENFILRHSMQLRRVPQFRTIYVKPERTDFELRKELESARAAHPDKEFVIYRGKLIKKNCDQGFRKLSPCSFKSELLPNIFLTNLRSIRNKFDDFTVNFLLWTLRLRFAPKLVYPLVIEAFSVNDYVTVFGLIGSVTPVMEE